jgi:hypothetical protein
MYLTVGFKFDKSEVKRKATPVPGRGSP